MNISEKTDITELIVLCRSNDDEAFAELVRRYTPMMHKVIASFFESAADVAEAFSEACITLHRAAISYNLEQTEVTFGLYAHICIRNRMVDLLRHRCNTPISDVDIDTLAVNGGIESRLIMKETVDGYKKRAKEVLSNYEYKVFLLVLKGCKTAEIAKLLDTSAKSVDNAKSRMWRTLRSVFGGERGT